MDDCLFDDLGLRINVDYELFKQSGEPCYYCWLGWTKEQATRERAIHIHPHNVGWVDCNAPSAGEQHAKD